MKTKQLLFSQYLAFVEILNQPIINCPGALWDDPSDRNRTWHIAYHTLFYLHLYAQGTEKAFTPWVRHRPEHQFLGQVPWPQHAAPKIGEPYDREAVLDYLAFCQQGIRGRIALIDLNAASGFYWLAISNLELQIYSLRHVQQHTGELMERFGSCEGIVVDWVGTCHVER